MKRNWVLGVLALLCIPLKYAEAHQPPMGCSEQQWQCENKKEAIYCHEAGTCFLELSETSKARKYLLEGCNRGYGESCTELGFMYKNGKGEKADSSKAATFFEKGCKKDSPYGCSQLGILYEAGDGVTKDTNKALSFYKKSCKGEPWGCFYVGNFYYNGIEVNQNLEKATENYKTAVSSWSGFRDEEYEGSISKLNEIAKSYSTTEIKKSISIYHWLCFKQSINCYDYGILAKDSSDKKTFEEALLAMRIACPGGSADACLWLSKFYEKDEFLKNAYLIRACQNNNLDSCYEIIYYYLEDKNKIIEFNLKSLTETKELCNSKGFKEKDCTIKYYANPYFGEIYNKEINKEYIENKLENMIGNTKYIIYKDCSTTTEHQYKEKICSTIKT